MNADWVFTTVFGSLLGGSGLVGLFMWFLRRYLDKRLVQAEREAEERRKKRIKAAELDEELHQAYGRMFFWIHRFILTGEHNGELQTAFENLQAAEARKKEFNRQSAVSARTE